ncbi:MAG: phosphate ABC transporter permease PstA [Acholeplasmataceae bacterium]
MSNSVRIKDTILKAITYLASLVSIFALLMIVGFVFTRGIHLLNWDLITHDYQAVNHIAAMESDELCNCPSDASDDESHYSAKWGVALKDDTDLMGKNIVVVSHIHEDSPFLSMIDKGVGDEGLSLGVDYSIIRIAFEGKPTALSRYGAEEMVEALDENDTFRELEYVTTGGGIRGSIITTIYLIGLTLLIALPIGISSAVYLNEYAKNTRVTRTIRSLIEMLTGVPSVIYGLMGLAVFVPITVSLTRATGGNLISGSLTLAVILLPVIIRTTEESLRVVPDELRFASLALGASRTQTAAKVVLPNAFPGILTATLLAIGRIIGESAALVFAIGTAIKDEVRLTEKSTSLAVHIWSMMTDEPANIELSSTIALIILIIVLSMNISIKLLTKRMVERYGR